MNKKVIWASLIGLGLPVLYVVSLMVCLVGNWRSNIKELIYFSVDMFVTSIIHSIVIYYAGLNGFYYMILSMAFGNGFLLHPLISFWIMQHLCHKTAVDRIKSTTSTTTTNTTDIDDAIESDENDYISLQPTLSYRGSKLWNWMNFNELSHVEHHDFARIPWTKTNKLAEMAPEFYLTPSSSSTNTMMDNQMLEEGTNLIYSIDSIFSLLKDWVFTKGDKMNFACIRAEAPPRFTPGAGKEEETMKTK